MLKRMGVLMGRGMEKEWFRRCPALASHHPPTSLSYAVVASSSRGFIPRCHRCALSCGFIVACWRVVVPRPCRAVDLCCRLVPSLSGCQ